MDDLHVSCVTFHLRLIGKVKFHCNISGFYTLNQIYSRAKKKYEIHEDLVFASVSRL